MAGRVSVLAAEVRTALGDDLETTWHALQAGRSGIRPIAGFDASGFASSDVAQVFAEGVAPEDDPALRILGAHGRLLERVTARAHDAGGATEVERSRVGLYVALGMVDAVVDDLVAAARASRDERGTFDLTRFFGGGYRQIHPLWPLSMLNNVAIGQLSIDYDVRGDNLVLASESDGGVRALLEGAFAVIDRRIDAALVGGVAEPLMPASLARAALRGTLGRGAAPGEGAAAVVLGPAGSPARATFAGGTTTFGAERGCPGASREAYARAFAGALASAEVSTTGVDAVFLHAGGPAEDADAELAAVVDVFGSHRPAFVATKGALGHTGPAAPGIDLALAVRALETQRLPPSVLAPWMPVRLRDALTREAPATPARILVSAASSAGAVGAMIVEACA